MCALECVCARQTSQECVGNTSPKSKYKQLTRASFNLIDIVLKNNTAYFGCSASKLTTIPLPDILLGRSAALEGSKKEKH